MWYAASYVRSTNITRHSINVRRLILPTPNNCVPCLCVSNRYVPFATAACISNNCTCCSSMWHQPVYQYTNRRTSLKYKYSYRVLIMWTETHPIQCYAYSNTGMQKFSKTLSYHLKILGTVIVTGSKFRHGGPQIFGATAQNLISTATLPPRFVHPWCNRPAASCKNLFCSKVNRSL
jgi:hypothetical protein